MEEERAIKEYLRAQTVKKGNQITQAMYDQDKEINDDDQEGMINDLEDENHRAIIKHVSFT